MNTLTIFCLFLALLVLAMSVDVDRLEKKAKNKAERKKLRKMLRQLEKGDDAKDQKRNRLHRRRMREIKKLKKVSRLDQTYDDLPVMGYQLIEKEFSDKEIEFVDKKGGKPSGLKVMVESEKKIVGWYASGLDRDLGKINKRKLRRSEKKALRKLKKKYKGKKINRQNAESVIYVNEKTRKAEVAYKVDIVTEDGDDVAWPTALYNRKGKLIMEYNGVQNQSIVANLGTGPGGNTKIGWWNYGSSFESAYLPLRDNRPGDCEYNTDKIKVVHGENHSWRWIFSNTPYKFSCYHQASDATNGGCSALNDANYFGHIVMDMFDSWFGTTPWPNFKQITAKVHARRNWENAQYWGPPYNFVVFGDGASLFYPLTSLDVVAHEIGHGVTRLNSDLLYEDESGGINEAFSDMTGKAAERFARGYNKSTFNWGVGYDIWKSGALGREQLRCMDNPPCDGKSIDHVSKYYNGMDVHYSSGIYNKVFYLLATKWPHDLWDAYDLFYIANTEFWTSTTDFYTGAEGTLAALEEMQQGKHTPWSYSWLDTQDVVDAFAEVGICCSRGDSFWDCVKAPSGGTCAKGVCRTNPCQNGGTCQEIGYRGGPGPSCLCPRGYAGLWCEKTGCPFVLKTRISQLLHATDWLMRSTGYLKCEREDCSASPCYCTLQHGKHPGNFGNLYPPPRGCGKISFDLTTGGCEPMVSPFTGYQRGFGCNVGATKLHAYVDNSSGSYSQVLFDTFICGGSCYAEPYAKYSMVVHGENHSWRWIFSNTPYKFSCYHQASDATNGGCSALNDANYFGHIVMDMFDSWFGTTPWPNFKQITAKVHARRNWENAQYWGPPYNFVVFGDGASLFYPLTSLDVVAHEIGHGVTRLNSDLLYEDESGGINEAFSNMTGKAAERFARGYNKSTFNWGVGYDIWKSGALGREQLRCMDNPPCDGKSIDHVSKYYNGMDVHYSSGIYNKVFYLLATKWPHDLWDAYDLFYIANTEFWTSTTDFYTGAEGTLAALEEMQQGKHTPWSYSWLDTQDVVDAFAEVGICCSRGDSFWDCVKAPSGGTCAKGVCRTNPCQNGGTCQEIGYRGGPGPSCLCPRGYAGLWCEKTDVVAHEIGHGVTRLNSNLRNRGESGGINEAFSDMTGKAAERFARGYNKSTFNWGVGYDIWKSGALGREQLRCMDNPPCDGKSIDHVSKYYDGMDVHYSSGIYNKVFYLLATKWPHDLWDAYDLFYIANTEFWTSTTDFYTGAEGTLAALEEMQQGKHTPWSYSWLDTQDVVDAFAEVGICCSRGDSSWDCVKAPAGGTCAKGVCRTNPCQNGGTCQEIGYRGGPGPSCLCPRGYAGLWCEKTDWLMNSLGFLKCEREDCSASPCYCTIQQNVAFNNFGNHNAPPSGCGKVSFDLPNGTCEPMVSPFTGRQRDFGCLLDSTKPQAFIDNSAGSTAWVLVDNFICGGC